MLGVDGYCGSEIPARKPLEVGSLSYHVQGFTLPETNIALEVGRLKRVFYLPTIDFQGRAVSFRECVHPNWCRKTEPSTLLFPFLGLEWQFFAGQTGWFPTCLSLIGLIVSHLPDGPKICSQLTHIPFWRTPIFGPFWGCYKGVR